MTALARTHVVVTGASGSGKSAICLLLAGVADNSQREAHIRLFGVRLDAIATEERACSIALVPSDPFLAFTGLKRSLRGELEMIQRLVRAPGTDRTFLDRVADKLDLYDHLHRDPFTLSGGEAVRAALAMALVKRPCLLVLDQIHEQLDPLAMEAIEKRTVELLPAASVIFETRSRFVTPVSAGLMANGAEASGGSWRFDIRPFDGGKSIPISRAPSPLPASARARNFEAMPRAVLRVRDLEFRYPSSGFSLGPLDMTIGAGERVALVGPNGSGKSTLLKCLALLRRPTFSQMEILGAGELAALPPIERLSHRWAKHALYCFQRPEDQLYLSSVREELAETTGRLGALGSFEEAIRIAGDFGLEPHLDRSPYDLSRSLRRLIPLAAALATNPPLLLLDEPTVGLDDAQVAVLTDQVVQRRNTGATVFISHDQAFVSEAATRSIDIREFRTLPKTAFES